MAYATLAQLKTYLDMENSDTVAAVSVADDTLTLTTQTFVDQLRTGTAVTIDNDQTPSDPPAPLVEGTVYYVILDADLIIQLATSSANASAGTEINLTDAGTGSNTLKLAPKLDDDLLEDLLDRATTAIDSYTNRTFEAAADTTHYFDYESVEGNILYLGQDLADLTSVANGDSAGTAIPVANLTELPRNEGPPYHQLRLDFNSGYSWEVDTDYWIEVVGKWAYSQTAPNDIAQACIRWAAYLYKQKDAQVFETTALPDEGVIITPQGIPRDVRMLLSPYRKLAPVIP